MGKRPRHTQEKLGRLSLRWGLIILASALAGAAVASLGPAVIIGTVALVAVALDQFLA